MLRVLEAQAPPKQNATDTINTLSSRLASATLLEDRRAAIQGLRSFAKEYPASVASGALRGLISELQKDVEDVDTEKVVLETLLMLFNPNANSPEASEDIALWLADEFSQRQENITVLLELLDTPDFYSRLYALQLLSAVSAARPDRTQDCILSAPLGTTRLVAVLDDSREAVRLAGLVLLNDVTHGSIELQKLVAFENAFDRIFSLILADGSISIGGIVVQDCLSLLANLLHLNAANQSLFRETGFVNRLAKLLGDDSSKIPMDDEPNLTREKNLWGLLAVLRMFLVPGNVGTEANQLAFEKHGVLQLVLNLGFDSKIGIRIRAEALHTCADMIRGHSKIQERFAHHKVQGPVAADVHTNGNVRKSIEKSRIYVIDALLNATLTNPSVAMFDVRYAACTCIQAYFDSHKGIRHHFLKRAIEGHTSGQDDTGNVLTIMINGSMSYEAKDPYRLWFAARVVFELIYDDLEAKNMAMAVVEGDAESGEEVVTCIQAIAGNLVTSLQNTEDERVCIGYLMVLCGWLYEDTAAVNDFLGEGSVIQSIMQVIQRREKGRELVQGLCTALLGILYEFSTKDSPVPRRALQPMLISSLTREHYISKLSTLRSHPSVRDYEVLPQDLSSAIEPGSLPHVYFDLAFVNFLKDNHSRILRAIDRDPGKEVILAHHHEGVDRDLVDDLRAQIESKKQALSEAEAKFLSLEQTHNTATSGHRRTLETATAESARIKSINEALRRSHDEESQSASNAHKRAIEDLDRQHKKQLMDADKRVQQAASEAAMRAHTATQTHIAETAGLKRRVQDLEALSAQSKQKLDAAQKLLAGLQEACKAKDAQLAALREDVQQRETQISTMRNQLVEKDAQMENLREDTRDLTKQIEELTVSSAQLNTSITTLQREKAALSTSISELETTAKDHADRATDAATRETTLKTLNATLLGREKELRVKETQAQTRVQSLETTVKESAKQVQEKEEARAAAQTEVDELFIVLADLEEKRGRDKKKLKELGAEISDDEDEDETEINGEDDGEDEDDEEDGVEPNGIQDKKEEDDVD